MRTRLSDILRCSSSILNAFIIGLLSMVASSCVHEFPDESTPAEIVLKLEFNIDIDVNVEMNMNTEINTGMTPDLKSGTKELNSETHDIRYLVKFFRIVNGEMIKAPVYEHTFTVDDINVHEFEENLEISEGQYRIFVWGDYVEQGGIDDYHYVTSDFPLISLNLPESGPYIGSLESRDAYVGHTDINVIRYGQTEQCVEADIDIQRPLAKFVILSSDLDEFVTKVTEMRLAALKEQASAGLLSEEEAQLAATKTVNLDEYDVRILYQGDENTMYNAPTAFDVFSDKPVATTPGLSFTSELKETINPDTGAKEALLGFDYIFMNGSESHTRVVVGVYDKDGEQVAMTPSIKIPLKRNQVTYVRGKFLMENTKGGVAIDPGFSGPDFNYVIM